MGKRIQNDKTLDGCSRYATSAGIKTAALKNLKHSSCVAQTHFGLRWHNFHTKNSHTVFLLILAMILLHQIKESEAAAFQGESHLIKRQNNPWREQFFNEMCSSNVKWNNACGGKWVGLNTTNKDSGSVKSGHLPHAQVLALFKTISKTFKELRSNTSDIDISDMNKTWVRAHRKIYSFLPRIHDEKVRLHQWHKRLQFYVASFTYLRRAQLHFDYKRYEKESSISKTLRKFELAALHILCEIETAINTTASSNTRKTLNITTPDRMREILKFRTKSSDFHADQETCIDKLNEIDGGAQPADPVDLKFVKLRFFGLLRMMRKKVKARSSISRSRSSSRSSSGSSSSKINNSSINKSSGSLSQQNSAFNSRSFESTMNSLNRDRSHHTSSSGALSLELQNLAAHRERHRKHHNHNHNHHHHKHSAA